MRLEIISPESKIFESEVDSVQLPGKDGRFQLLNSHAPLVSTLVAGEVKIEIPTGSKKMDALHGDIVPDASNDRILRLQIKGGVVEVNNNKVILLAD